jgi:hypothetical protein
MLKALVEEVRNLCEIVQVYKEVDDNDFAKSLRTLAKRNKGLWKSESQGKFLLRQAERRVGTRKAITQQVRKWARSKGHTKFKGYPVGLLIRLLGYGHKDPSKIRYTGLMALLDEQGVFLLAQTKVKHAKGGVSSEEDWTLLPATAKVVFERKEEGQSIPYFSSRKAEIKKTKEERGKAKALAQKIKALPDFGSTPILQSFADQLDVGHSLSPRQLAVVNKFLDKPEDLGIGDRKTWQTSLDNVGNLVREKLLPVVVAVFEELEKEDITAEVEDYWTNWTSGGSQNMARSWIDQVVKDVLNTLTRNALKGRFVQDYLFSLRDSVARAAKSKRKPSKKSVLAITTLRRIESSLKKATSAAIRKAVEKAWR